MLRPPMIDFDMWHVCVQTTSAELSAAVIAAEATNAVHAAVQCEADVQRQLLLHSTQSLLQSKV